MVKIAEKQGKIDSFRPSFTSYVCLVCVCVCVCVGGWGCKTILQMTTDIHTPILLFGVLNVLASFKKNTFEGPQGECTIV